MDTRGDGHPSDEETASFVDALAALKRQGSALLVVGAVPEDAYHTASRAMLGDSDATPPRRRLLVVPNPTGHDVERRLRETGPVTPETARVVAAADGARSVETASGEETEFGTATPASSSGWIDVATTHVDGSIGELGAAVVESVEAFDTAAGGLDPAQLRVAFDCVPSLVDRYDEETLFRFLALLTSHVRMESGMIHVWLPQPRSARQVRLFEPLFDAVVELKVNDTLTQRWEFRDSDVTSDWFEFETV